MKEGRIKRQIFLCFSEIVLEVGERQMANNVMQEMRVYGGYLVGLMQMSPAMALEILPPTS